MKTVKYAIAFFPTDGTKYESALGSPDHHMGEQSSLTEAAVVSY